MTAFILEHPRRSMFLVGYTTSIRRHTLLFSSMIIISFPLRGVRLAASIEVVIYNSRRG